ncbi:ATP phosphoribosyltransferase regulatory subunit [Ventosimonas gracilis]|uniref:ATP phosphoribosyltransferase regulatory subunit n=1 Tax=Ventosimonas gracilis TaxID=1680762 RepID=A0A139SMF7_9GAMM|nr:ATP phosphoribosyltransferase regulatory subunit [Ventosimonas gracilis]KXU35722.1 ATP phosphoribosyltransferase regulatory subunit [Ventosimonas gracilis]
MIQAERWLLPDGIEEVLPPQAARIEAARREVLDLFARWGYEFVITPHIEFLESLLTSASADLDLRTFKVTDPLSGRQMGLRADITPQVARVDAHSLGRAEPTRLCYAGSVLHTRPRALATSRSPIQLGAELYGDASGESDIEVISLMLAMLEQMQVKGVHLDLGHVGIYRALAKSAQLPAEREQQLFDALQAKACDEVAALTQALDQPLKSMLCALPRLCGGKEVLARAKTQLGSAADEVKVAIDALEHIANALAERWPDLPLHFDLAELRGYHYHSGVVFAAFVPAVGGAIAQGGRYDDIGAQFGRARPATGFSTDLKTLTDLGQFEPPAVAAPIWAPPSSEPSLWHAILRLRQSGRRVIQALPGQDLSAARAAGCTQQLLFTKGSWQPMPLPPLQSTLRE